MLRATVVLPGFYIYGLKILQIILYKIGIPVQIQNNIIPQKIRLIQPLNLSNFIFEHLFARVPVLKKVSRMFHANFTQFSRSKMHKFMIFKDEDDKLPINAIDIKRDG